MGRVLGFFLKLIVLWVALVSLCVGLIISDGLKDKGDQADVGLVSDGDPSDPAVGSGPDQPALEKAAAQYKANNLTAIIVSGSGTGGLGSDPKAMGVYLMQRGVPDSAILSARGKTTIDIAHRVAELMNSHTYLSCIVITPYYHVTHLEMALSQAGVKQIGKSHVGVLQKEDAIPIAHEMVAFFSFLKTYYLMPTAEKIRQEAQDGFEKAKGDAQKSKDDVNKKLDNLSK